jgi:hypothetical protein
MTKKKTPPIIGNRETWLINAVEHLAPLIHDSTDLRPCDVRVSVGWPSSRGISTKQATIGQCWPSKATTDGVQQIFISPVLNNGRHVLATLVHELIHAYDDCASGHKGAFARAAKAVGLEGKMTATVVTDGSELDGKLQVILGEIGDFPSAGIKPAAREEKVQSTRMLKVECEACDCVVRMTRKWLDEVGPPRCGCGGQMMEIVPDE